MTKIKKRGWYGQSKRHALARMGIKSPPETYINTPITNIDNSPEVIGYRIFEPHSGEELTYIEKESLNTPLFRERITLALPPSQYEWVPIKEGEAYE